MIESGDALPDEKSREGSRASLGHDCSSPVAITYARPIDRGFDRRHQARTTDAAAARDQRHARG